MGMVEGSWAHLTGPDRQALPAQAPIGPQLQGMAQGLAELALEGRSLERVLASELTVENNRRAGNDQGACRSPEEPATARAGGAGTPARRVPIGQACDHPGVSSA